MDSSSDLSRCELDSVASSDSMHLFTDEIRCHSISIDANDVELSKRIATLEMENERLRMDVENSKIETNATIASNRGLKNKIAELFVEMQIPLQEKRRLENSLKDANVRLLAAEKSSNWYRTKLHDSQANAKTHETEIETYREILRRRQQNLIDVTSRCEEFDSKCAELVSRHDKEKQALLSEIEILKSNNETCKSCLCGGASDVTEKASSDLLRYKLEEMEKFSKESLNRLRMSEQRLANSETLRNSLETVLSKYRHLESETEHNMKKLESEKSEMGEKLNDIQTELRKVQDENEQLHISVLMSKHEQIQVEEAIVHLHSQLDKIIDRYTLLKSTNSEAQRKLSTMQNLQNENKRLKLLLYAANNSLFKKLWEQKRRVAELANQLEDKNSRSYTHDEQTQKDVATSSMRDCLRQALERNEIIYQQAYQKLQEWQDLEEHSKTKISDESIDEGYGDGSIVSSTSTDLLSSPNFDSVLIKSAVDVLSRSKNFMRPLEKTVEQLRSRMGKLKEYTGE